jgi:hypothetical protein
MDERMTQALTAQALWRAVRNKRPAPGLIHHSVEANIVPMTIESWLNSSA